MINKAIVVGSLGADPESRYTQGGTQVVNFNVATSEKYKDHSGNQQEKTEWHKINAWGKLAEICEKYLQKGSLVYIEGKLQTRKYQAQDGTDRYTTEIVAREMKILARGRQQNQGGYQNQGQTGYGQTQQGYGTQGGYQGQGNLPGMGEDVPF